MVFCAAGWSPVRSAACKRSHESPHSSPLCFLRLRLVGLASTRSLHCHVPVGSTAPLLVDRSQDRVRPRPCTACSRSHGALTHGVRAAQRVALPPRLRPLLLRPRLVPTHRRFVARPSRFLSRKGHWATARACTGRGPRSTTSTRSVSARQAGRRVPRQYIRSDVQCPVRACSSV